MAAYDIFKLLEKLPTLLDEYTEDLSNYAKNLTLKGKTLEFALKEQPTWSAYYGERMVELNTILKQIEIHIKKVRATIGVRYNENYNPALSERQIEKYIDREDEYLVLRRVYVQVEELKEKYEMVIEAFNRRGFALRDITTARVHEIQGVTL